MSSEQKEKGGIKLPPPNYPVRLTGPYRPRGCLWLPADVLSVLRGRGKGGSAMGARAASGAARRWALCARLGREEEEETDFFDDRWLLRRLLFPLV